MEQSFRWNRFTLGTCYYPEHWPSELWADDLRRMLSLGITQIRIAEFAWNKFEPEEGQFTDSFFRSFLDLCAAEGMKVILGTPTATPPAWLTEKYPEVLNARKDGVLFRHGCRRHYNYNSPKYRELSSRVVDYIGRQLGSHPAVIGWQIDNELNCETDMFFSEADDEAFRKWLQTRFGTLERLNEDLGTVFWNQTYTDWSQLHLPRPTVSDGPNPHMMLEYSRFISESTISFCAMQSDILRKYLKPGDFITTNGLFDHVDNPAMVSRALDVYTFDNYPDFGYALSEHPDTENPPDQRIAGPLSEVRGICPHFGIMEQQSGGNGWVSSMQAPAPRPGQLGLWSMQSIAYGADMISFFRWRTSPVGTEIYWHGILEQDNRDNRRIREITALRNDLEKIAPAVGSDVVAGFAILKDYDNAWDLRVDVRHRMVMDRSMKGLLSAALELGVTYDVVFAAHTCAEELSKYPVVFMPHDMIVSPEKAALLEQYVRQGGTLVIGCCTGTKDIYGKCPIHVLPGLLRPLSDSDVRDFTCTSPAEAPVTATFNGHTVPADVFCDILAAGEHSQVVATYDNSYFAGQPAMILNSLGSGRVLHWGSTFSAEAAKAILEYLQVRAPYADLTTAPRGVSMVVRSNASGRYLFALNFKACSATLSFSRPLDLMTGNGGRMDTCTLPPFGYAVFQMD